MTLDTLSTDFLEFW
ncbi:hypothetical protein ID866_12975 [Astraeus odoratus]|nr:hypothetical protein ID866_12975 [Astraeus odoratus]